MFLQAPKHEARQQMATQLAKAGIWPQNDNAQQRREYQVWSSPLSHLDDSFPPDIQSQTWLHGLGLGSILFPSYSKYFRRWQVSNAGDEGPSLEDLNLCGAQPQSLRLKPKPGKERIKWNHQM
jgi:hypothetical protein